MHPPSEHAPVVVVTGASSGIGRATALLFANRGHTVVAVARTAAALEALAAAAPPGRIRAFAADATRSEDVERLARLVDGDLGGADVVVHSAGLGVWKYLEDTTDADLTTMLGAPFMAAVLVTRALLPTMLRRRRGVILHVASPVAFQPWAGTAGYAMSRWGMRGLHESLRMDLHKTGVHSCHVVFGEVTSSYFDNNPDSRQHIPTIARLVAMTTPERCAEILVDVAAHPRHDVFYPLMLRIFMIVQRLFPTTFRWFVNATGRKRLPPAMSNPVLPTPR